MTINDQKTQTIIRRKQVQQQTGLSRSSIYQMISKGKFPKAIKIGERSVGWLQCEIDSWIASRIEVSRRTAGAL